MSSVLVPLLQLSSEDAVIYSVLPFSSMAPTKHDSGKKNPEKAKLQMHGIAIGASVGGEQGEGR